MLFWFVLIISSPFIVSMDRYNFEIYGWLAIGHYDFDFFEGLQRSFLYFFITLPVMAAIYKARPNYDLLHATIANQLSFASRYKVTYAHVLLLMVLCIIFFMFNLGITGVETDTGGWRLSGIAHYIRSYLFMGVVGIYIFGNKSPSYTLVILYAVIAGGTSGSRFVATAPIILFLIRNAVLKPQGGTLLKNSVLMLIAITLFALVTIFRKILYDDSYTFTNLPSLLGQFNEDLGYFINDGILELFLRLGIGRDVILSTEVAAAKVCTSLFGLFFGVGSCMDPAFDFYGVSLGDGRFGLSPPMLSSIYIVSDIFYMKLIVAIGYSLIAYILCVSTHLFQRIPLGALLVYPAYLFMCIFVLIGPIVYGWILLTFVIAMFYTGRVALSGVKLPN